MMPTLRTSFSRRFAVLPSNAFDTTMILRPAPSWADWHSALQALAADVKGLGDTVCWQLLHYHDEVQRVSLAVGNPGKDQDAAQLWYTPAYLRNGIVLRDPTYLRGFKASLKLSDWRTSAILSVFAAAATC